MKFFWQSSPEWLRERELCAELKKAGEAMDKAGAVVLASLRMGTLNTEHGRHRRAEYMTAHEAWQDAYVAWEAAGKAFKASPAGQAREDYFARLRADPIARASAPVQESA